MLKIVNGSLAPLPIQLPRLIGFMILSAGVVASICLYPSFASRVISLAALFFFLQSRVNKRVSSGTNYTERDPPQVHIVQNVSGLQIRTEGTLNVQNSTVTGKIDANHSIQAAKTKANSFHSRGWIMLSSCQGESVHAEDQAILYKSTVTTVFSKQTAQIRKSTVTNLHCSSARIRDSSVDYIHVGKKGEQSRFVTLEGNCQVKGVDFSSTWPGTVYISSKVRTHPTVTNGSIAIYQT